jgi:hypothetical protein
LANSPSVLPSEQSSLPALRILFVEGDPVNLLAGTRLLRELGHQATNDQTKGVLINKSYIAVQADPGKNTITLLVNDFINNTLDSMVLETAAGKAHFIQAKPGMFGAFTLVELDEEAGMREVSYTEFYQTN